MDEEREGGGSCRSLSPLPWATPRISPLIAALTQGAKQASRTFISPQMYVFEPKQKNAKPDGVLNPCGEGTVPTRAYLSKESLFLFDGDNLKTTEISFAKTQKRIPFYLLGCVYRGNGEACCSSVSGADTLLPLNPLPIHGLGLLDGFH